MVRALRSCGSTVNTLTRTERVEFATGESDDETIRDHECGPAKSRIVAQTPYHYRLEPTLENVGDYRRKMVLVPSGMSSHRCLEQAASSSSDHAFPFLKWVPEYPDDEVGYNLQPSVTLNFKTGVPSGVEPGVAFAGSHVKVLESSPATEHL